MRFLGHFVPRNVMVLVGLEGLLVLAGLAIILPLQFGAPGALGWEEIQLKAEIAVAAGVVVLSMAGMGLYDAGQITMRDGPLMLGVRLFLAMLAAVVGILVVLAAMPALALASGPLLVAVAAVFILILFKRVLYQRVVASDRFKRRILTLGVGSRAAAVAEMQGENNRCEMPYVFLGYVATPGVDHVNVPADEVIHQQEGERLLDICRRYGADELVVAVRDRRCQLPVEELLDCKLRKVSVIDLTSFLERERRQLRLDSLNTSSLIFGEGFRQNGLRTTVKRVFDILVSLVLLLITLPIMIVTALAIKLESQGPIFFRQQRVGSGNEPYWLYKFRSMRQDAEKDGVPVWAQKDDDRVTRVGRVIRKLRIDELPQILNVLKGEMSFVGPRPERPLFVDRLSEEVPFYRARHTVPPGITGWAQICYPYGASVEDARQKLQYDLYYVKNHTFFLDLVILIRTVAVVLFGQGAR
ncbi:TIGR03013 family XrtA/PEP-CTERM system glycosyltransferase [Halorhodospira halophila]|uniref:TIGR03013 family XrtA/PEP-CTERM system glycosyltransferase n=1 Tax=Halorhodospira TaxID=85108 RepID=UPI001EE8F1DB|nr:TIGR03013 family PEP-CTERM/XrtA system glycosyltransferase [Halorhodospira halophila]MCG5542098.1 TIGR03013 family PEP-CTERM/XrtA system glycosyltransferase [Halorhodospira sp. 9628]